MLGWTPTWTSSCCSPTVPRTLPKILCPPTCGSSSRRFLGILTSCPCKHFNLKFSIICDTGSWDHHMGCGPTPFVPHCQILSICRATWKLFTRRFVPIEPFVDGWGPQSTESRSFLQRVAAVVIPLIGSALVVSKECVPPVSQCSKSVRSAANFRRLMTIVGSSAGAQAMVYRAQVAGAVDAPPDEPASSSGWRAEDSLARVAGARAITWRRERGYEKDEDFAFAFSTWEEAVAVGGHFLADAWLAVRVAQQDELLPAAARLLEGGPLLPDTRPPLVRKRKEVPLEAGVRLHERVQDQPESIQRQVLALQKVFLTVGALKPVGLLTEALKRDWQASVLRLAQTKVAESESVTIQNALRTYGELHAFLLHRGRSFPPDFVDMDNFLHQGTMAPTRALNALRWLCKHSGAPWEVARLRISPELKKKATSTKSQALVVEPGMLQLLEERIESMCRGGDPRWTCLLGSWLVATGCLRYQHLRRSTVRRISPLVFHGHCRKGKQRHARGGFDWCAPAEFASTFNWTVEWLKAWKALSPVAQKSAGICFDGRGTPWNIAEVQHLCQSIFAEFLDNTEQLTTYSWRRMLPTVGHILNLSSSDLCSLGDWQDKSKEPAEAGMALHYSSARYAQSLRNKILATSVAHSCEGHSFWEEVLPADLDGFREVAKEKLALSIAKDKETRYAAQPTKESLKTHLQFSRARVATVAANKIRGSTSRPTVSMPDAIRGRVLTAFLKNGRRLCGAFQMPSGCDEGEEVCGNAHMCAVLLARGRACGGSHGAFVCTEKKYLAAATPVPVRASPTSATTSTQSKAKPTVSVKRRREDSPQPSARPEAPAAPSPRPKTPQAPPHKAVPPKLIATSAKKRPREPSPGCPLGDRSSPDSLGSSSHV